MPKTSANSCKCINGCGSMERNEDYNFLSKVNNMKPLQIDPATGIPVKIYFCRKCGYVENYLAVAEGFKQ